MNRVYDFIKEGEKYSVLVEKYFDNDLKKLVNYFINNEKVDEKLIASMIYFFFSLDINEKIDIFKNFYDEENIFNKKEIDLFEGIINYGDIKLLKKLIIQKIIKNIIKEIIIEDK